ncbi:MAG: glycosyltransferase family 4 protein [Bacteroidales bacterium]
MKILYIHQYFKTPAEGGGTRSYWISQQLANRNHEVIVLTSRNYQESSVETEIINGIKVVYIRNFYDNTLSNFYRIISFISFVLKTIRYALRIKNINVVYATSTPLTVGIPAIFLKILKKTPYIFEVRDLWPDIPVTIGIIKNPLFVKLLYSFEKSIYRKSYHIIALSPGMKNSIISKGIDSKKLSVIPNMCDLETFFPTDKKYILHRKLNIPKNSLVAIHTGAMGMVNGLLKFTRKVALELPEIFFVFIGEGKEKEELIQLSLQHRNIRVHDGVPKTDLNQFLNDADVFLMLVDPDYKLFETNSANKFFDYLSVGNKPVIMNYKGWKYDIIEKEKLGFYINQDNIEQVKNIFSDDSVKNYLNDLKSNQKARQVAINSFDKSHLTIEVAKIVERVQVNNKKSN